MSIFNDAYSNDFRLRVAKATAEELWTKDDSTGEYFRVTPGGGGGGGALPYYLKTNHIKIDDPGTPGAFTNVDHNSVDVTSTNYTTSLGNGSFLVKNNSLNSAISVSDTALYVCNVHAGTSLIDTTKSYTMMAQLGIAFKTSSGSVTLNRADVIITNNLKALTAATPVEGTSKMLIYNPSSKVFNHADIPTSVVPYAPKLIKLSGKEWKQGDVSSTAGLDFTSRALVSGVHWTPTPDAPPKKQQKRYIQWFYNRNAVGGTIKGPPIPTTFTIPAGTIFPGDIIDLEIFSADADDIISNVDEYAIFIGSPDFSSASLKSLDISATSDNPYLNVTAYPTEIAYFSNGVDNTGGVDSFPGIMLTYIYNGRDHLGSELIQHHHLTSFRIQYKGKLMTSVNVTSP